ncbi:nudix domain-containing protein [Fusarium denticulatum]|uniref:Nudix domain-containing protein n=1 Tax=Fusarium denticulatum TaxID=48507 RepID=A0A8H5T1G6_9HYPO|nr:nudix domain-containing protein [Fusarium denticulatum]
MGYLTYESDSSVADFTISKQAYLTSRPEVSFGYIATSSLVLDTTATSEHRILLLQRAETDDDAGKWEPPGGACDDCDKSILSAAARELHEEAGLNAKRIGGPVDKPHFFTLDDGKSVCQFNFLVRVDMSNQAVKLSPDEHQRFIWATEDEVKTRKVGDIDIEFTRDEVQRTVLAAFHHATSIHV